MRGQFGEGKHVLRGDELALYVDWNHYVGTYLIVFFCKAVYMSGIDGKSGKLRNCQSADLRRASGCRSRCI
jgi:hypothetical protein